MESESYVGSSASRPKSVKKGGKGSYCCIPNCKSRAYNSDMTKTGIGFFKIPKNPKINRQWKRIIYQHRRKGVGDNFKIKAATVLCEFHFETKDIKVSLGRGKKSLRPGAVPKLFSFKQEKLVSKRKSPKKRLINEIEHFPMDCDASEEDEDTEITKLRQTIEKLEQENLSLKNELDNLKKNIYSYDNISKNEKLFKSETGLSTNAFNELFTLLDVKENCDNIKFYDSKVKGSGVFKSPTNNKQGPKVKLEPKNQLLLVLSWLKGGFSLKHSSWLFDLSISTTSRYIITWINLMYFTLGSIPIWPSKLQIQETMPKAFKETYPSTRCIIDCTELFCQRPSSLSTQSNMYSQYKSHVTYKGLLGIAPSGSITFISQLYEGSISDKEIVDRSGLINKNLWDENDSIMADRGFTIKDLLKPLNVDLNIPSFLEGRSQLSTEEVKESQAIASVRIHVERAIQRVKKFKQIRNEIPLTLHGSINQIWTVACLLCNFMSPLIQKDTEDEK